jgi:vomeronasal 2 receptor
VVKLIQHFGWVWVGTIAADDDFGNCRINVFTGNLESVSLCIAFSETIPKVYSNEKMQKAVHAIKSSTAKVIVLFASDLDLSPFVMEMAYHTITDRTWITSEAWITSALIAKPEYFPYFGGSIGFTIPRSDIPGLKEFLMMSTLARIQMMFRPLNSGKLLLTALGPIAVFHTTLTAG